MAWQFYRWWYGKRQRIHSGSFQVSGHKSRLSGETPYREICFFTELFTESIVKLYGNGDGGDVAPLLDCHHRQRLLFDPRLSLDGWWKPTDRLGSLPYLPHRFGLHWCYQIVLDTGLDRICWFRELAPSKPKPKIEATGNNSAEAQHGRFIDSLNFSRPADPKPLGQWSTPTFGASCSHHDCSHDDGELTHDFPLTSIIIFPESRPLTDRNVVSTT